MSFETYNKGNNQKNDSVNTRGIQMKNKFGVDASTLVVQYWDDKLNLMLHPQLKNPTEKQVYDYEQKIMVTLRVDKAQSLLKALDKIIDKAIEEDKEASVGILLGGTTTTNMVVVSTVKREGNLDVVLYVCRELNPTTKLPAQRFSYTFIKDEEVIEGYNVETGNFENIQAIQSEYLVFKEALREYVRIMLQGEVHSDRYNDKFYRTSLIDKVTKIGDKVGALDSGHYTGSYNKNTFATTNFNQQPSAQTTSLDDLKDIFN
jgi:hypothetical protein